MTSHPERPQRKRLRLEGYDYAQNGAYFITVCTQNRVCLFGSLHNGDMVHNAAGEMIWNWWSELAKKFPNVEIDAAVVMPNHFHGIVVIHGETDGTTQSGTTRRSSPTIADQDGTTHRSSPTEALPLIMQWFKTMTTNAYIKGVKQNAWESFPGQLWQRSFHDHIIRNEQDMNAHRQYILSNPTRWQSDENYLA